MIEEKQTLINQINETKEKLNFLHAQNDISQIQSELDNELTSANLYLNTCFRLSYKQNDLNLFNTIIGELMFTDSNYNVAEYIIDIDRLKKHNEPVEISVSKPKFHIPIADLDNTLILSLPKNEFLISSTNIEHEFTGAYGETEIRIIEEHGQTRVKKLINDFSTEYAALLSDEFIVFALKEIQNGSDDDDDDDNDPRDVLRLYDLSLTIITKTKLKSSVFSLSTYKDHIFVLFDELCAINVYDSSLKCVYYIDNYRQPDCDCYNIFIHNNLLYSDCSRAGIEVYDLNLKQITRRIDYERHDYDTVTFIDSLGRIIVSNQAEKYIKIFNSNGQLLFEYKIDKKCSFCITKNGHLAFFDDKLDKLLVY